MSALFHIVCTSVISASAHPNHVVDSARIARNRHESAGITGVMAFDGWRFLLYMEGEAEQVDEMVAALRRDPCHQALTVLHQGAFDGPRRFRDWASGYPVDAGDDTLQRVSLLSGEDALRALEAALPHLYLG
ncbi:BLUF domain-containing protein [Uliginosibacterium sp. H1]|uniref:BLUF domain-containing protein n=1 Tax=Uliginosibacterium sp. H1 TaxID=3114757 RepID=UPI002E172B68|nr:BLUF domain-containing protein [Uliginosibacterium sp. H1]